MSTRADVLMWFTSLTASLCEEREEVEGDELSLSHCDRTLQLPEGASILQRPHQLPFISHQISIDQL